MGAGGLQVNGGSSPPRAVASGATRRTDHAGRAGGVWRGGPDPSDVLKLRMHEDEPYVVAALIREGAGEAGAFTDPIDSTRRAAATSLNESTESRGATP